MTLECELVKDVTLECELDTGEAKSQSKTVTPTAEPQIVYPDSGFLLSSVRLTEPLSQEKTVTSAVNQQTVVPDEGYLLSSVTVDGMPTETASVTPTEQTQTVTPSEGKLLSKVTVEPIPSQYIVPSGELNITENVSGADIKQYASLNVAVPVPVMPEEYAIGGSLADNTATGYYIKRGATTVVFQLFQHDDNLEMIDMPDSIKTIANGAFYNLKKLQLSKLPSNLTSIGADAFRQCEAMTLSEGLPNGLISIGGIAFLNCKKLNFASIPDTVTSIGSQCFMGCTDLEIEKLSNSVTSYPLGVFSGCTKGKISEIPAGVTSIGQVVFYGNLGMTNLTFKGTPNTIEANSFQNCTNLLDIYVPWSEGAVANAPWGAVNATITYDYTGV